MKWAVLGTLLLVAACAAQTPAPVMEEQNPEGQELGADQESNVERESSSGESSSMESEQVVLPILGPAPELQNETWLNTSGPLRLADLRGSVVLIDMWTFG